MYQTNIIASPAARRGARLNRADMALAAMAVLFAVPVAAGHAVITPAGAALSGLSLLVTLVVVAFARRQLRADPRRGVFTRLALGLALGTLLMALSGNALLLAVGWIVTGRMMAGLIGHVGGWAEAREAARRASLAYVVSDLALVGAVITLALATGSADIATIAGAAPSLPATVTLPAALLMVLAALARCAIPPFSGWLLGSLAAPTPVSALMHAGFVNAGGFLLVHFAPVLEAAPAARFALFGAGVAAALIGSAIMLVRSDVKGALAASTVAQMGFMLLTVALGAYAGALWHMAAHGLFKAWLFLGSSGTVSTAPTGAKGLDKPLPAVIALLVITAMGLAIPTGIGTALLPVGLALAALIGALAVASRSMARTRLGLLVMATPLLLIAVNVAVLAAIAAYQPAAALPLLSPYAQFGLLSLFLAAWVWQQRVSTGERALPPALAARLLHAGAFSTVSATSGRKD